MKATSLVMLTLGLAPAAPLGAQSLLDRPPNLAGAWVPDGGVVRFDFLHRFWVTPGPTHTVVNYPSFTLAVGLPEHIGLGLRYATKGSEANETEVYARWQLLHGSRPLHLSVTPAYNSAAQSLDGEISADWTTGRITLAAAARGMSKAYGVDRSRAALAGGAVLRLNDYVAIAADFASLVNPDPGEDPAWSAGLLFVIPGSPHTFSLHASNVGANTIEGSSRRDPRIRLATGKPLYGFEFTIPLHLNRFAPWFHGGGGRSRADADAGPVAAAVEIQGYRFRTDTVTITTGQAVRWTNYDPVEHTVTFDAGGIDSGLMGLNQVFVQRFDRPGVYRYHCAPHSYMNGVVIVK